MIRQTLLIIILAFAATTSYSQDSLRVLFLGNSYTSFNNLPGITASLAEATNSYLQTTANLLEATLLMGTQLILLH